MAFQPNCVRDLLKYLDKSLSITAAGKRPRPIHLKRIISTPPLDKYASEDVYESARYLYQKNLITLTNGSPLPKGMIKKASSISFSPPQPKAYIVKELTAQGLDLLKAFSDDTIWNKAKEKIPSALWNSVPDLLKFLISLV